MNVLHLIDAACPQACPATYALIADTFNTDRASQSHVWLLGGPQLAHDAAAANLNYQRRIAVPRGHALLGLPAVRHHLRRHAPADRIQHIHAWSASSLALARLLMPRVPRTLMLTQTPSPAAVAAIVRLLAHPGPTCTEVQTLTSDIADTLAAAGAATHLIKPLPMILDPHRLDATDAHREALRRRWGAADPSARVIALVTDPPTACNARAAAITLALTHESVRRDPHPPGLTLLVHPDQQAGLEARELSQALGNPIRIVQESQLAAPWQVLAGIDIALATGPGAAGLGLAWARVANVPILAACDGVATDQLLGRESAVLAENDQPRQLAHHLTTMLRSLQEAPEPCRTRRRPTSEPATT